MTLYHWSKTAANNGTADVTCPFPEGMGAPALNDGARGMMAAVAKHRDDIAGAIVTAGTSTAYTVASFQAFDSLADMSGQVIAFTPHATNGATVTLNVDGLGAKPLRTAPSADLLAGVIIQGSPYLAVYNNADGAFYLQGFYGNPYNIPLGAGLDYWGTVSPNGSFAFAAGQAISRTIYAGLFALVSTFFGPGDGATTFNLPDKRGRASFGADNMGGSGAGRLTAASGMGTGSYTQTGGAETETLTLAQLPGGITSTGAISGTAASTGNFLQGGASDNFSSIAGAGQFDNLSKQTVASTLSGTASVTSNNTSGQAHPIIPPAIVCNYIIRIL